LLAHERLGASLETAVRHDSATGRKRASEAEALEKRWNSAGKALE
jgi:hypothetical protein